LDSPDDTNICAAHSFSAYPLDAFESMRDQPIACASNLIPTAHERARNLCNTTNAIGARRSAAAASCKRFPCAVAAPLWNIAGVAAQRVRLTLQLIVASVLTTVDERIDD
jgi:hypothetical protein